MSGPGPNFAGSAGALDAPPARRLSGEGGEASAPRRRPLVKVCGLTRPEDAAAAVEAGADLLGLNFHPPSPRCLRVEAAAGVAAAARAAAARLGRPSPLVVGVFVDLPAERVAAIDRAAALDLLQFHGDPSPEEVAPWGPRAVAVVRLPKEGAPSADVLGRRLEAFRDAWGFLLDVRHDALWGGSGESFAWPLLAAVDRSRLGGRPLLVAGGITPANARRALAESGADGVDVASGVEAAPGVKDPASIRRLLQEVHR